MGTHDFLSAYGSHAAEYLVGIGSLVLFAFFWRYVNGGRRVAALPAAAQAGAEPLVEGFRLPEAVFFHPGHVWARSEPDGRVAIGLDDFGHRLVGPLAGLRLPAVGAAVGQGERAFTVSAEGKELGLLSPVGGTVVAVNERAAQAPAELSADPYGAGWLVKVEAPRLAADLKQLLAGSAARHWLEGAAEALRARLSPELGAVLQDGGVPVPGIAREIDPEGWDQLARSFFLT